MRFACTQENLLQGLSLVGHTAGKSANLPILSHVLIKIEDGNVKLSTTNLEMAVSAIVRGRVEQEGSWTVPAKLFQDYVALLSPGKIEIALEGDSLEIRADGKTTKMKGLPASEFPFIPKLATEGGYLLKASALKEAISQVGFAVSASESRPELAGVACFFQGEMGGNDRCVFAATDSYRLSERVLSLERSVNPAGAKCIVPARAMNEIGRLLSAYKDEMSVPETVEWQMAESQFVVTYGNVELVSRLIDGSFPDYRQIIPTQFKTTAVVSRQELAKAIRAASLFARQGLYDVHVEIKQSSLIVTSADSGTGTHTAELAAEVQGEPNRVLLNYKYVMDGLNALSHDKVTFQVIDAMNPVVMRPGDGESPFQYIVMPIRQ